MNKVTAEKFRTSKEFTLPSGITMTCYSSLLIGELDGKLPDETDLDGNLAIIIRMISAWNFFEKESDEKPLEITLENFKKLPTSDFQYLMGELKIFSTEQKKS